MYAHNRTNTHTRTFSGHVRKCHPGLNFADEVRFVKTTKFYTPRKFVPLRSTCTLTNIWHLPGKMARFDLPVQILHSVGWKAMSLTMGRGQERGESFSKQCPLIKRHRHPPDPLWPVYLRMSAPELTSQTQLLPSAEAEPRRGWPFLAWATCQTPSRWPVKLQTNVQSGGLVLEAPFTDKENKQWHVRRSKKKPSVVLLLSLTPDFIFGHICITVGSRLFESRLSEFLIIWTLGRCHNFGSSRKKTFWSMEFCCRRKQSCCLNDFSQMLQHLFSQYRI